MGSRTKEAEFEEYRLRIYPWVREIPGDAAGWEKEGCSPEDTPLLSFVDGLMTVFVIQKEEEVFEILKDSMLPEGMTPEEIYRTEYTRQVRCVCVTSGKSVRKSCRTMW